MLLRGTLCYNSMYNKKINTYYYDNKNYIDTVCRVSISTCYLR